MRPESNKICPIRATIFGMALLAVVTASGCAGGGDQVGRPTSYPPGIDTGRVTGRVKALVPVGAGVPRSAGRHTAAQPDSLEGFIVTIPGTNLSTTTDAYGNFTISFVPRGRNTMIEIRDASGTRIAKALVHIDTRQTADVTLDMATTLQTLLAEQVAAQLQSLIPTYADMSIYEILSGLTDDQIAALLEASDVNGDGAITLGDFDANGDGVLSGDEIDEAAATTPVTDIVDELVIDAGANVVGVVTDKTTGAPIAGALVKIYATGYVDIVLTDDLGRYAFYNVPAGTYYIIATKDGYTLETKTVTVE